MTACSVPVILLGEEGEEEEDAGQLVDHVEEHEDGGGVDLRTLPHHHEGDHLKGSKVI